MNVYLYEGKSRFEATEALVTGNSQAVVGETYSVDADKGVLVVAYPNYMMETVFGFNYWVEAEAKPGHGQVLNTDDNTGE